jgi:biotin operon repressor
LRIDNTVIALIILKAEAERMKALKIEAVTASRDRDAVLEEAYVHLTSRRHTTLSLARALGVSPATAFRVVKALRRRGLRIESMKEGPRWYFAVVEDESLAKSWEKDPLLGKIGFIKGASRRGKSVDEAVYSRR